VIYREFGLMYLGAAAARSVQVLLAFLLRKTGSPG